MTAGSSNSVVVIGGGVIGLTAAVELLARTRRLSVTVLERTTVGHGASGYAGAMDVPYFRNAFQRELVRVSWAWHKARGDGGKYRRMVPMTWYAEPDLDLQSSLAAPLAEDPLETTPGWAVPAGTRPLHGPAFVIDSREWCAALVRELVRSGRGAVVQGQEVIAIDSEGDGRMSVRCADGRGYEAGHVVLALGPWLAGWDTRTRAWAASIGLRTKRVFGVNVKVDGGGEAVGWPRADIYFHPAPWAMSGGEYCLSLRHDEWDVDPDAEHRMVDKVLERAATFLQLLGVKGWSFAGQRVFVDSYTPEFQVVVGPCSGFGPNVTIATGTHGSGVRMAPGVAELVARAVLDRLTQIVGVE